MQEISEIDMSQAFYLSKFRTSGRFNRVKLWKDSALWDLKLWPLAVLTGDRINEVFFYKKMYDRFAEPKRSGCNNEVTVLPRWP